MNKHLAIAVALPFALVGATELVSAGPKYMYPVSISSTSASGSLGTARNSTDNRQQIGCYVYSNYEPPLAYCIAHSANDVWATCQTNTAKYVTAASSINGDSWISFSWTGGTCTSINIGNHSFLEPKL